MKHILKKNNVIITALAIMLAVAGYLNFSKDESITTSGIAGYEEALQEEKELLDLSEEDLAERGLQVEDNGEVALLDEIDEAGVVPDDGFEAVMETTSEGEIAAADDDDVGEAVMVSNTISGDYFSMARINREQSRAKSKELLLEIVNNDKLSESQKENAVLQMENMAAIAEKESAAENLLSAKGFSDAVVSIIDDSVDVIVNAEELTSKEMAQIEDIVKRKTEVSAENIVITPVAVQQ